MNALAPALLRKEFRALLPAWTACILALGLATWMAVVLPEVWFGVYLAGATLLGSLSLGQEYANGTLSSMLSQPTTRARLLAPKLLTLAVSLLTLWAVAGTWLSLHPLAERYALLRFDLWHLPVLCALLLAPWFTMAGGGPVPAIVFTIAVPAVTWIASGFVTLARFGLFTPRVQEADLFRIQIFRGGLLVWCAVGAVMIWRSFAHLQSVGEQSSFSLPQWAHRGKASSRLETTTTTTFTRRHPVSLLLRKEFRLQRLTFAIAVLYLLTWVAGYAMLEAFSPSLGTQLLTPVAMLYGILTAVLIGSLASAEERQLGTLEWQLLLPWRTGWQWAIKVAFVLAAAALLAFGLPLILETIYQPVNESRGVFTLWQLQGSFIPVRLATTTALAIAALYVSSLCVGGLRAFVMALPTILGAAALSSWFSSLVWGRLFSAFGPGGLALLSTAGAENVASLAPAVDNGLALTLSGLLLWLGGRNHRWRDRTPSAIRRQIGMIAAAIILSVMFREGLAAARSGAFWNAGSTEEVALRWLSYRTGTSRVVLERGFASNQRLSVRMQEIWSRVDRLTDRTIEDYRRDGVTYLVSTLARSGSEMTAEQRAAYDEIRRQTVVAREVEHNPDHPGETTTILRILPAK